MRQAGLRLNPRNDRCFHFAKHQSNRCHSRPSNGYRKLSKGLERLLQATYLRWPPPSCCDCHLEQCQQASVDCRPPQDESHRASRWRWYKASWSQFSQQNWQHFLWSSARDAMFVDTLESLVNYAGALYLEYDVKLVEESIKHLFDSTLSSEYIKIRMQATYMRYMRLAKLWINYNAVLSLLERLSTECRTGKNLGTSHLGYSSL